MSDVVTTLTVTLRHGRALAEQEFKNLVGNVVEHIQEEHGKDLGDWGFRDITDIRARATHHGEDGNLLEPIHAPVVHHLTFVPEPAA